MWRQALSLLAGMLMLSGLGCVKVSACFDVPEECPLTIAVEAGTLRAGSGGELDVRVSGRSGLLPLTASLTQPGSSLIGRVSVPGFDDAGDSVHLSVAANAVAPFSLGLVNLMLMEGTRSGMTYIPLNAGLLSANPLVSTGVSASIERLGFSGGKILSLRSYIDLMSPKKKFSQYSTSASTLTQDTDPQSYIFKEFTGTQPTADFAASRVVWLDVIPAMGLSLVNCPTNAMMASECSNPSSMGYPNNLLPLDIKAFAISPMAELAVISESSGALRFASLPSQSSSPPPLAWAPLTNQPIPSRKDKVLLDFGDLDGNSTWDLLVLHQDAQQQDVSVYLGQSSGAQLVYDKSLSDSWQAALGTMPISAMALGDLDSDNRADVAIGRGSQVTVWSNQKGLQPLSAWSAEVQKDVPIRALAIGQVDAAGPNDLVAASSTSPDAMGNATQYLHAYLGR